MPRHLKSFAALVLTAELCSALQLHAAPAYITNPIPVRVTHVPDWFRPTTSSLCFNALSVDPYYVPPTTNQLNSGAAPLRSQLLPVASWTLPNGASSLPANVALVTQGKKLVPGNYILECWLDLNGDGKFTPGEPYGCEKIYGLTPTNVISRIGIEIMEVSPSIARMDLSALIAAMPSSTNSLPDVGPLAAATDRGLWHVPYASVTNATWCGTNKPFSGARVVRVRVVRAMFNGDELLYSEKTNKIRLDHYFDLSARSVLTEADLISDGMFLDPGLLVHYAGTAVSCKSAGYRVVIGDGDVGDTVDRGNNLPIFFANIFEGRLWQAPTTNVVFSIDNGYPVFGWSQNNLIGKPYPGFQLRIFSGPSTSDQILHDTGILRAPPRSSDGRYSYTLPVKPGDQMFRLDDGVQVATQTFSAGTNYWVAISMIDDPYYFFDTFQPKTNFVYPASP